MTLTEIVCISDAIEILAFHTGFLPLDIVDELVSSCWDEEEAGEIKQYLCKANPIANNN